MKLLVLACQTGSSISETIIWTVDLVTRNLIKCHVEKKLLEATSIGDCIEASLDKLCKRQEIWIKSFKKFESVDDDYMCQLLDKKAATPYSIREVSYGGNVCKIEEFISINKKEAVVSLYGFPKEKKYISISDEKWIMYVENCVGESEDIINALNLMENKYVIVDFPKDDNKGLIHIAALVVI